MSTLTPNQIRVTTFIRNFMESAGYAPTLDEIADGLGVTKPTIQQYLAAIEEKGVIRRKRYTHRSIEITDPDFMSAAGTPLLGRIAAGQPIEAVESETLVDIADILDLDGGRSQFLLQVEGNSMIEDGIFDGDFVVVEKARRAENGQTVVALLPDGNATLKRFYKEKQRIRLQPANPDLKPIYVKKVTIQGIV
ncbi:transcriptional repressor LexA, partial [Planctomycetota bacterium]